MKKTLIMLGITLCMLATNALAQEVRGVETRLATYQGEEYVLTYQSRSGHSVEFGRSSDYYGFEFKNLNSISVSVSIEIYKKKYEGDDELVYTKEIVLKSKESYICKYPPKMQKYDSSRACTSYTNSSAENWEACAASGKSTADQYYVKYKAFKLL